MGLTPDRIVRPRSERRRRRRPLLKLVGVLIVGAGGLIGWAATQPPPPDPLPYYVALPRAGTEADAGISVAPLAAPEAAGTALAAADPARVDHCTRTRSLGTRTAVLHPAAHPALVEQGRYGPLPVVASDCREAWQVYARPFDDADPRAQIAVVLVGLGRSQAETHKALQLPGEVTLAFSPYGESLEEWVRQARAAGHEVLLEVPMEPSGFPKDDPGPRALLTSLGPYQNLDRLEWLLARFTGYVGVLERMGDRFTASQAHLEPLLGELERRGLLYLGRPGGQLLTGDIGVLQASADLDLDLDPSRAEIAHRLAAAEAHAGRAGAAVVIARPYPVTLDMLRRWLVELDGKGLALAPLTAALARRARG